MSRTNFLIKIMDEDRTETRYITIFAVDGDSAYAMGEAAANAMAEGWHKGREFYVDEVKALE